MANNEYYRNQINLLLKDLQACTVGRYPTDVVNIDTVVTYLREIVDNEPIVPEYKDWSDK